MNSAKHEAILRSIRTMAGMLHHKDRASVMSSEQAGKLLDALYILRRMVGMSPAEFILYAVAGVDDLHVIMNDDGKPVSARKGDGQAVTFVEAESRLPLIIQDESSE